MDFAKTALAFFHFKHAQIVKNRLKNAFFVIFNEISKRNLHFLSTIFQQVFHRFFQQKIILLLHPHYTTKSQKKQYFFWIFQPNCHSKLLKIRSNRPILETNYIFWTHIVTQSDFAPPSNSHPTSPHPAPRTPHPAPAPVTVPRQSPSPRHNITSP